MHPRVLRTEFAEAWNAREADSDVERLRGELLAAIPAGRAHELVPFTGQTAGSIRDVLPVAEIVRRLVEEAEAALRSAPTLAG